VTYHNVKIKPGFRLRGLTRGSWLRKAVVEKKEAD